MHQKRPATSGDRMARHRIVEAPLPSQTGGSQGARLQAPGSTVSMAPAAILPRAAPARRAGGAARSVTVSYCAVPPARPGSRGGLHHPRGEVRASAISACSAASGTSAPPSPTRNPKRDEAAQIAIALAPAPLHLGHPLADAVRLVSTERRSSSHPVLIRQSSQGAGRQACRPDR